jgi:hypothetical protein
MSAQKDRLLMGTVPGSLATNAANARLQTIGHFL